MPRIKRRTQQLRDMNSKRWKHEGMDSLNSSVADDTSHAGDTSSRASDNTHSADTVEKHNIRLQNILRESGNICNDENNAMNGYPASQYMIVDFSSICELFSCTACPDCFSCQITPVVKRKNGFAQVLELFCTQCNQPKGTQTTSRPASDGKGYDVNYKVAEAFLQIGKGYSAIEQFGKCLNMPVMSDKTFSNYQNKVHSDYSNYTSQMFDLVRSNVREAYRDVGIAGTTENSESPTINIAVSFDGTWHTRGHNSNYAVGCVIDVLSGYVVDFEVISKFCYKCDNAKRDLGETSPEFAIFMEGHRDVCSINHCGSSNSMEMKAALKLWQRSEKIGFRYTTILSDGDSKTYNFISAQNIYGPDVNIEKEECINHVSKRLGTALRNIVKSNKARGITLGGRGHGCVKESTIQKLTNYYQKAILSNKGDIAGMKTAIYATLHHSVSTDNKPRHFKCPKGTDSWCFYQSAIAKGQKPGPHKKHVGTPLKEEYLEKLLPVYQRLADDNLLKRCINCLTQNANESLHNLIWMKCPKTVFVSKLRVELAAMQAVCHFNIGERKVATLSLPDVGDYTRNINTRRVKKRASGIKKRNDAKFRQMRQSIKRARLLKKMAVEQKEGVTYSAGVF